VADVGVRTTADAWRSHPSWGRVPPLLLTDGDRAWDRLVVVSAHPVDESLGAGGLIATAHASGVLVYVVLLTAGEPPARDAGLSRHALATLRLREVGCAFRILAPDSPVVFLGADGGEVDRSEVEVAASLTELIGDGRRTLLVAPWRHDGHPDHDAAGRAAAEAAHRTGARLAEYPVRAWRDQAPDRAPWRRMRRLDLSPQARAAKDGAIAAHASQVAPDPARLGPAALPGAVLEHFAGTVEHFVVDEAWPDER
jgi:LmbE family N-acetylglucosaminyl deacetylase